MSERDSDFDERQSLRRVQSQNLALALELLSGYGMILRVKTENLRLIGAATGLKLQCSSKFSNLL
jgi:hypothetical protein